MKIRRKFAALAMASVLPLTLVACGTADDSTSATSSTTTSSSTTSNGSGTSSSSSMGQDTSETADDGPAGGRGPGGVDAASVGTEEQLVALVNEAYGEAALGLHRGHQPIEDVLDEVLQINHDELHVRMEEQGQNLAAVAEDLGIDPQTLIDALVESFSPAIDNLVDAGTITEDEGQAYLDALEKAFTFRVNWDGQEATPTFAGIDA